MTPRDRIEKGKFRIGVKKLPLYRSLLDKLGDMFKPQIFMALSLNDKDMISELKNLALQESKQNNILYI